MPSAWDEMEEYESGTGSNIHPACWLGQYSFGLFAGLLGSFFVMIFVPSSLQPPSSGASSVSSSIFSLLSVSDVVVSLFSSLGVFAGSSGGGDPLSAASGGGPLSLLAIFLSSTIAVLASTLLLEGRDQGSSLPACSAAAAVGTIVAGWGVAVQLELERRSCSERPFPGGGEDDGSDAGGGSHDKDRGGDRGDDVEVGGARKLHGRGARRPLPGRTADDDANNSNKANCAKLSLRAIYNGIQSDLSDPSTLLRIAFVMTISLGIHLMYGGIAYSVVIDEEVH